MARRSAPKAKPSARKHADKAASPSAGAAVVMPAPNRERVSLSIRKIQNGYLVSQSGTDRHGNYFDHERFTPRRPKIDIKNPKRGS